MVTYPDLFQFIIMLCEIVAVTIAIIILSQDKK